MSGLLVAASFLIGSVFGSFLNVCVYRIPRGISMLIPARSYCPSCKAQIPWRHNVPILSWLRLRGRCAECGAPISIRYPLIELSAGLLFSLGAWLLPFPLYISAWIFTAFLIVATFVDLEFFIIPDSVSIGGLLAGLVCSLLFPPLHQTTSVLQSLAASILGACVGAAILFLISELGKLAFGRYRLTFPNPAPFFLESDPDEGLRIVLNDGRFCWEDHFFRKSDRIVIAVTEAQIDGHQFGDSELVFSVDKVMVGGRTWPLQPLPELRGLVKAARFPREAMGFGDVKLMAMIGAFTGWTGVLFTIPSASMLGSAYGLIATMLGRRELSAKIPFGPYLSLGALLWIYMAPSILDWYRRTLLGF